MNNEKRKRGLLVVLSGPSGVGKSTLTRKYLERHSEACFSISATTREQRKNEIHGKDYFFMTDEEFRAAAESGKFAEHAEVFGHMYGTPVAFLEEKLSAGRDIIMDIDVKGAAQLMEKYREGIFVFVAPPSVESLKERLLRRAREGTAEIELRLKIASQELACENKYMYKVINDNLDEAISGLESIIIAEKLRINK